MPFASSPALGFNQVVVEFYSILKVEDDGCRVQGKKLVLTKEAFSSQMGVVGAVSKEFNTLEFKDDAFNHFFGKLGNPFDNLPPQFTFILFQSFSHKVLHCIVTVILLPKEGTQLVTLG